MRTTTTLLVIGVLCLLAFIDCSPAQTCAPGKTESCACLGGSQAGVQTCLAAGSGWGSCVCPGGQKDGGQIDMGLSDTSAPCTRIFSDVCCSKHQREDVEEKTPGCNSQDACNCLVTPLGKVFVCAASKGAALWKPLGDLQSLCSPQTIKDNPALSCARDKLLCDACPNEGAAWRFVSGGCAKGVLKEGQ